VIIDYQFYRTFDFLIYHKTYKPLLGCAALE